MISQKSSKFSRNSKHVNKSSFKLNWQSGADCTELAEYPFFYGTACKLQAAPRWSLSASRTVGAGGPREHIAVYTQYRNIRNDKTNSNKYTHSVL